MRDAATIGRAWRSRSAPVLQATTPGSGRAPLASTRAIRACAWGLRAKATWSRPGRTTSPTTRSARVAGELSGCGIHGLHDAVIAGASAQHRRQRVPDVLLARPRVRLEEIERRHQHPRRAEPALQAVVLAECLLERMELAVAHQAFDRDDLGAGRLHREHQARPRGFAVHEHRARAADAVLAAHVRAGQREIFAQEVDEQLTRLALSLARGAVHGETYRHELRHHRP